MWETEYEAEPHIRLTLDVNATNKLIHVKCLIPSQGKHWKLESERNLVWYSESDVWYSESGVLGQLDDNPTMNSWAGLYKF